MLRRIMYQCLDAVVSDVVMGYENQAGPWGNRVVCVHVCVCVCVYVCVCTTCVPSFICLVSPSQPCGNSSATTGDEKLSSKWNGGSSLHGSMVNEPDWLGSMRTRVQSLALLSGLRIWHCCELWYRLAAVALNRPLVWEPPYATSAAPPKKKQKKKKKRGKESGMEFHVL